MLERVLVPLDGSAPAEQILVQVARLLRREDADVILLGVVDAPGHPDRTALIEAEKAAASDYLAGVVDALSKRGARARFLAREGEPADVILRTAEEEKPTLVALSTHGRSGMARFLLGSVAERVLRACPVPVLLRRSFEKGPQGVPLPAGPGELPFRHLLVPVDGSDGSLHVVPQAAAFAKLFEGDVDVLHVEDPPPPAFGLRLPHWSRAASGPGEAALAAAEKAVRRFREYGVTARPLTALGEPASLILETAELRRSDLIVMASHGRTGLSRWALGSVTERILRHAEVPVLVVRART